MVWSHPNLHLTLKQRLVTITDSSRPPSTHLTLKQRLVTITDSSRPPSTRSDLKLKSRSYPFLAKQADQLIPPIRTCKE